MKGLPNKSGRLPRAFLHSQTQTPLCSPFSSENLYQFAVYSPLLITSVPFRLFSVPKYFLYSSVIFFFFARMDLSLFFNQEMSYNKHPRIRENDRIPELSLMNMKKVRYGQLHRSSKTSRSSKTFHLPHAKGPEAHYEK